MAKNPTRYRLPQHIYRWIEQLDIAEEGQVKNKLINHKESRKIITKMISPEFHAQLSFKDLEEDTVKWLLVLSECVLNYPQQQLHNNPTIIKKILHPMYLSMESIYEFYIDNKIEVEISIQQIENNLNWTKFYNLIQAKWTNPTLLTPEIQEHQC